ncbi:MAG: hypothetical protein ACLUFT_06785, partial [Gemmiger formicilis]|uniref:hypothetical protein n=1 Tax=Gemmiger formicilis TaxID=745368 RepID=UPI0039927497
GVSRRQLCAGGGADGNEQTGEQGSQKIGIKKSDAQLFTAVRLRLSKNSCRGEHCSPVPVRLVRSFPKRAFLR